MYLDEPRIARGAKMMTHLNHKVFCFILIIALSANFAKNVQAFTPENVSQTQYRIDKEWAIIWIKADGSIELHYNITITYESSASGYLKIGLPKSGFTIHSVTDLAKNKLIYTDVSSGNDYVVEVYLGHAMSPGSSGTVLLEATVPNMLSADSLNPGYMGMQFMPTYFKDAQVIDLRVAIVPPLGVTQDNIRTSETAYLTTVDGAFAVYWSRSNLAPNTQLTFGVSIPQEYVTGPNIWSYLPIIIIAIVAIIVFFIYLYRRTHKAIYEKAKISIEALGAARGLTAVEAAVVVDSKPIKVLTMILFGLLRKRFVTVKETKPLIKLEMSDATLRDTSPLRYYEIDFLKAIEPDGALDERNLARTYLSLRDNVDRKMRGYSRVDTVNYYKSIVDNAWKQVTQAATPQLKGDTIESNMEWLLMDDNYDSKFKQTFPPNIFITPQPTWWWYWHGPYSAGGTTPTSTTPSVTPIDVKPIPAQEWANNIVRGLETTTNSIVKDIQKFTNNLIPPQTAKSSAPVHHGASCVCACAHCACACACVGCACACAGGGAR